MPASSPGLSEVALVVGADTTPKGFLAPNAGERWDDPDWLRFRLVGMTNPGYFALYARRRIDLYGATPEDFAQVKVKNARHGLHNPNARYRKEVGVDDVLGSAIVADPLHLLDICATSDGGAAVLVTSMEYARRHGIADPVRIKAISTVTPTFPQTVMDMPNFSTDSPRPCRHPSWTFKESIGRAAYEEAGIGPEDVDVAEVYDLSTALELDWMEDLALCGRGEAEKLLRAGETTIGGRDPGQPLRRARLLRRGGPRPGARPGVRADLAAARARPTSVRSREPGSASPPTRASSATAPR